MKDDKSKGKKRRGFKAEIEVRSEVRKRILQMMKGVDSEVCVGGAVGRIWLGKGGEETAEVGVELRTLRCMVKVNCVDENCE